MDLKKGELRGLYKQVKRLHQEHLAQHGVRLPRLMHGGRPTKGAIVLCMLYKYVGQPVSKAALTRVVRRWHPDTPDVQQGRHLARQGGFHIISGTRGDQTGDSGGGAEPALESGEYCLVGLDSPYPGFSGPLGHRAADGEVSMEELKAAYGSRCATCGSKDEESNFLNPSRRTTLHVGHMDPTKPLSRANAIPQCDECNRAYKDWFIFDERGRVRDINMASGRWRNKYALKEGC